MFDTLLVTLMILETWITCRALLLRNCVHTRLPLLVAYSVPFLHKSEKVSEYHSNVDLCFRPIVLGVLSISSSQLIYCTTL